MVAPRLDKFAPAAYDAEAERARVRGRVVLHLTLDESGTVVAVDVAEALGAQRPGRAFYAKLTAELGQSGARGR